jgi:DNA-directed RNA polymerase alpha subunit
MPPEHRRRRRPDGPTGPNTSTWSQADLAERDQAKRMATTISELGLSLRTVNIFEKLNILFVSDLYKRTDIDPAAVPNLGEKTRSLVCAALIKLGLTPPPKWQQARPPKRPRPNTRKPARGGGLFDFW